MRRILICAVAFILILGLTGCSGNLPEKIKYGEHTYLKTDLIYQPGELNLRKVGEYRGRDVYEEQDFGYNEKYLKDEDGSFVLYKIEGVLIEKPNIYLYPKQTEQVTVWLDLEGRVVASNPLYRLGWQVTVEPDGLIDGRYHYLYYEAFIEYPFALKEGWVIDTEAFSDTMAEILERIGLTDRAKEDFITYWSARLDRNTRRYAVYYLGNTEIDEALKLRVSPAPDSLLRAFFWFEPYQEGVVLEEPLIQPFRRDGFTVVEWGGILR